ncbi:outer membrane beta-barrel protein [Marinifilum flexuosum]|uniref:Outer membrane protein with beta-barrel domain n=1 Tax=Marinifilum flexuosum TaxID=1117708 RepID=A0A419X7C7_9BACT|nr:outer membrane beta-barrel protein [Marinifilum flexuosum]RKE03641.1 outer membrane protein with beta-barrel domain [Marinifilum flexuosum]
MKNRLVLIIVTVLAVCFSFNSKAQDSKVMVGAGLGYATDISNLGIFAKGVYMVNDTWEIAPSFTYYFKKDYTNWSSLDFNGQYVFSANEKNSFYAIGGLNLTFWKVKLESSDFGVDDEYLEGVGDLISSELESNGSDVGVNIGVGSRFALSDKMYFNADIKYTLGGANYLSMGVGILYNF